MNPSTIILDLLRTYPERGLAVQSLMDAGLLFGFSQNLMRVNLSRLVGKGLLENFQRGHYRLTALTNPVNAFAEEWRRGEARLTHWQDRSWHCIYVKAQGKARWALSKQGFRTIRDHLWVRPSNLSQSAPQIHQQLIALGLDKDSLMMSSATLCSAEQDCWFNQFDIKNLDHDYNETRRSLTASIKHLPRMTLVDAKRESFSLGGAAIKLLATDPLLPQEYHDPKHRIKLWQAMVSYDELGRKVWAEQNTIRQAL